MTTNTRAKPKPVTGTTKASGRADATPSVASAPGERLVLDLDDIIPAPDNLRGHLGDVTELAESIRSVGLVHDLVVTGGGLGGEFLLVDGHRRYAAARIAGLTKAPCVVRPYTEAERLEAMLSTAIHRQGLSPVEQARGFARLAELGLNQRAIAERVLGSKSQQGQVSKALKLLALPEQAQTWVSDGQMTLETARDLADLPEESQQRIVNETGGRNLEYEVRNEKSRVAAAARRADVAATLTKRGVLLKEKGTDTTAWRYLAHSWDGQSATEPDGHDNCVAADITGSGGVQWYCTDPDSHPTTAAAAQITATEITQPIDAERAARDEGRRREAIAKILASAPAAKNPDPLIVHTAVQLVRTMNSDFDLGGAAQLLDIETAGGYMLAADELNQLVARTEADPHRALLALALDGSDRLCPTGYHPLDAGDLEQWGDQIRAHYALLTQHGYELTDEERTVLDRADTQASE